MEKSLVKWVQNKNRDSAVLRIFNYSKCQATFPDALHTPGHEQYGYSFADICKSIALNEKSHSDSNFITSHWQG